MGQLRHHAERAFEAYLRARRTPYVSVNEARKTLLPHDAPLKSFDFVVYLPGRNLLVDIKGRRLLPSRVPSSPGDTPARVHTPSRPRRPGRLECWVTREDIEALQSWQSLFGDEFEAAFVFAYSSTTPPQDGLFAEVFPFEDAWYGLRMVTVARYAPRCRLRSPRWQTVDLSPAAFEHLCEPFFGNPGDDPLEPTFQPPHPLHLLHG